MNKGNIKAYPAIFESEYEHMKRMIDGEVFWSEDLLTRYCFDGSQFTSINEFGDVEVVSSFKRFAFGLYCADGCNYNKINQWEDV